MLRDKVNTTTCDDIAEQLIEHSPGNNFKVPDLNKIVKKNHLSVKKKMFCIWD